MSLSRRNILSTSIGATILSSILPAYANSPSWSVELPVGVKPSPVGNRRVGVAYSLWHYSSHWGKVWGHPVLGEYASKDQNVMHQHALMLKNAGVDFILLDLSNDLADNNLTGQGKPEHIEMENSVGTLFEVFSKETGSPNIAIMVGFPGQPQAIEDGRLKAKVDQVWQEWVGNPHWKNKVEVYLGKPLLVVYVDTPSPFQKGLPSWNDERFTVRFLTGFISDQPNLHTSQGLSRFGYWSWEDRGPETFSVYKSSPEEVTVVASWRGNSAFPSPGRSNGENFIREWQRARAIGPHYVIAGTFNEWRSGEQPSAEQSKDLEPSKEFGDLYLRILREQGDLFKAGR